MLTAYMDSRCDALFPSQAVQGFVMLIGGRRGFEARSIDASSTALPPSKCIKAVQRSPLPTVRTAYEHCEQIGDTEPIICLTHSMHLTGANGQSSFLFMNQFPLC